LAETRRAEPNHADTATCAVAVAALLCLARQPARAEYLLRTALERRIASVTDRTPHPDYPAVGSDATETGDRALAPRLLEHIAAFRSRAGPGSYVTVPSHPSMLVTSVEAWFWRTGHEQPRG
jgi:hypothetical protein